MSNPDWLGDAAKAAIELRRNKLGRPVINWKEILERKMIGDLLLVIGGMVFDVKPFLASHPGGESVLLTNLGKDATAGFMRSHGESAHGSLAKYYIGDVQGATSFERGDLHGVIPSLSPLVSPTASLETGRVTGPAVPPATGFQLRPPPTLSSISSNGKDGSTVQAGWDVEVSRAPGGLAPLRNLTSINPLMAMVGGSGPAESKPYPPRPSSPVALSSGGTIGAPRSPSPHDRPGPSSPASRLSPSRVAASSPRRSQRGDAAPSCPFMALANLAGDGSKPALPPGHSPVSRSGKDDKPPSSYVEEKAAPYQPPGFKPPAFARKGSQRNFPTLNRTPSMKDAASAQPTSPRPKPTSPTPTNRSRMTNNQSAFGQSSKWGDSSGNVFRTGSDHNSRYGGSHFGGSRESGSRAGSRVSGSRVSGSQHTNGVHAGGHYRETNRKRRQRRTTQIRCPDVDMVQWARHTAQVKASWDTIVARTNFADIGIAIYDKIASFDKLESLFSFTDSALQGRKFVDMLNSIMINLESPQKIHQKMVDLAPLHHRRAVSGAHMPIMGPLLISVFASIAGGHFTHEMRVGWEWFWEFMSRSMEMSLQDVGSTLNVVQTSWEDITERHSNDEIGRAMYAELFRTAPTLSAALFSTEKANDMASKMGDMLGLLVSHADDPTQLKQQVFWLGRRHVLYGVRPHMIPLMGPIIMGALADAADDNWGTEEEKAWGIVINIVIDSMMEAIAEGEEHGRNLEKLWAIIDSNSGPQEFGAKLYPHFTKTCVCTFLQGFCAHCHDEESKPFFSMDGDSDEEEEDTNYDSVATDTSPIESSGGLAKIAKQPAAAATPEHTPLLKRALEVIRHPSKASGMTRRLFRKNGDHDYEGDGGSSLPPEQRPLPQPGTDTPVSSGLLSSRKGSNSNKGSSPSAALGSQESPSAVLDSRLRRVSLATISHKDASPLMSINPRRPGKELAPKSELSHLLKSTTKGAGVDSAGKGSAEVTTLFFAKERERRHDPVTDQEEVLGEQTWNMIETLIALVWEPERQQEKIYVICCNFFRRGMRSGHIKMFGEALRETIIEAMGPQKDESLIRAWDWFWREQSQGLMRDLDSFDRGTPELIAANWNKIVATCEIERLGHIFWTQVNHEAPEQTHLYRLPLRMWGHLFKHIVHMLVLSARQPERFYEELFELVIRHIRYGVRSEFLNPMGKAIFSVLRETLGEDWNEKTEQAWRDVWKRVTTGMARGLNLGGNSMTHGLVSGNVDEFQRAVAVAPRSRRAQWLCQIDVNGLAISPLYWAINDGKIALAEFILNDLLTIRADMSGYYYGRQELFENHTDLIAQLCQKCPELLANVLDGLMWHSKEKVQGRMVHVNYYIADLYGDPDLVGDVWESPLAVLVRDTDNETFKHPVVRKVLQLKWESFGLKMFLVNEIIFAIILTLFMITHVFHHGGECEQHHVIVEICLVAISALMMLYHLYIVLSQIRHGKTVSAEFLGMIKLSCPRYLASVWNWFRVTSALLTCATFFVDACGIHSITAGVLGQRRGVKSGTALSSGDDTEAMEVSIPHAIQAVVSLLMWVQMLQATIVSTPMAAFTYTIGIMINDLSHSFLMIGILLMAFASALAILNEPPFNSFTESLLILIEEVLGVSTPVYTETSWLTMSLVLTFVVCVIVGFLNILIAQLTITYDRLTKDKEGFALKHRAQVCLDIEDLISLNWRRRIFRDLGFHKPLPFGKDDLGPMGGIQVLEHDSCDRYIPDRVMRFTGSAEPTDPWPIIEVPDTPIIG